MATMLEEMLEATAQQNASPASAADHQESPTSSECQPEPHELQPSPHDLAADEEDGDEYEQECSAFSPTWDHIREKIQQLAMEREHYHGYPLLDDECPLVLHKRFPMQGLNGYAFNSDDEDDDSWDQPPGMDDATYSRLMAMAFEYKSSTFVNAWFDKRRQRDVAIFRKENGQHFAKVFENSVGSRATFLMMTIGVSRCWDIEAEMTAQLKLSTLLPDHLMKYYLMTGTFIERSKRSGVLYMFRRCRPTLAFSASREGNPRVLCALCMHPIGYYQGSFGGAMVPTDDVIAHLICMRGDEHHFWKCCNQHSPWMPEAGL